MSKCRHRQLWIGKTVRMLGFINRKHIEQQFSISGRQAATDIQRFIDTHKGMLTYNTSAKRYELIAGSDRPAVYDTPVTEASQ